MVDREPTPVTLDPYWLKNSATIRALKENLPIKPLTKPGDDVLNNILLNESVNPLFKKYPRLSDVISILVGLIEAERGASILGESFFNDRDLQVILLKAIKMHLEDIIKEPYSSEESAKYESYKGFFEDYYRSLNGLERQIIAGDQKLPNILNSIVLLFNRAVNNKIPEVRDFSLRLDNIRNEFQNQDKSNEYFIKAFEKLREEIHPAKPRLFLPIQQSKVDRKRG